MEGRFEVMNRAEKRKALKSINTPKKFTDAMSDAL